MNTFLVLSRFHSETARYRLKNYLKRAVELTLRKQPTETVQTNTFPWVLVVSSVGTEVIMLTLSS